MENTAASNFWSQYSNGKPAMCFLCETGKIHPHSQRRPATKDIVDRHREYFQDVPEEVYNKLPE
jgi:hypothetical protein